MGTLRWVLVAAICAWPLCVSDLHAAGPARSLVLASGERRDAQFLGLDDAGRLRFSAQGKEQSFTAAEIVTWGAQAEVENGPVVVLVDGSLLVADLVSLSPKEAVVENTLFGELKLPLERVRGIVLRVPADVRRRDEIWERLLAAQGEGDQVLLENGDSVAGSIEEVAPEAAVLNITAKSGKVALNLAQVLAILVNPALTAAPKAAPPGTVLGLRDGSLLRTRTLTKTAMGVELELASGIKLVADDAERFASRVEFVRGTSDRVQYLSNLAPLGYKHVPFLDLQWPYKLDRNVLGGRLRSAGRVFEKGVGMHSSARLAWSLPPGAKRFEADVALDAAAGREGSVVFRVYVGSSDGKFRLAYESPVVRGGEAPRPVSVDVSGGAQLALIVDFADRGDVLDHANWLEARVVK